MIVLVSQKKTGLKIHSFFAKKVGSIFHTSSYLRIWAPSILSPKCLSLISGGQKKKGLGDLSFLPKRLASLFKLPANIFAFRHQSSEQNSKSFSNSKWTVLVCLILLLKEVTVVTVSTNNSESISKFTVLVCHIWLLKEVTVSTNNLKINSYLRYPSS